MPLRASSLPHGHDMLLYRNISYGNLANFFVLDARQYRNRRPVTPVFQKAGPDYTDPKYTMLGEQQRNWLFNGLENSTCKWNTLAQQVMVAAVARVDHHDEDGEPVFNTDQWPGYEADRRRLLSFLHESKLRNTVVITGDIHANYANDLIANFDQLESHPVATEFVGTSITSGKNGEANPAYLGEMLSKNPFVKFHDKLRGYVSCEVTPQQWISHYRTVNYVTRRGAPLNTAASFVVEQGQPYLQKA